MKNNVYNFHFLLMFSLFSSVQFHKVAIASMFLIYIHVHISLILQRSYVFITFSFIISVNGNKIPTHTRATINLKSAIVQGPWFTTSTTFVLPASPTFTNIRIFSCNRKAPWQKTTLCERVRSICTSSVRHTRMYINILYTGAAIFKTNPKRSPAARHSRNLLSLSITRAAARNGTAYKSCRCDKTISTCEKWDFGWRWRGGEREEKERERERKVQNDKVEGSRAES